MALRLMKISPHIRRILWTWRNEAKVSTCFFKEEKAELGRSRNVSTDYSAFGMLEEGRSRERMRTMSRIVENVFESADLHRLGMPWLTLAMGVNKLH